MRNNVFYVIYVENTYSVGVECFLKWTIEAFELDFDWFDYKYF